MSEERIWTAAIVIIGDEVLSGRTQDKNVAQIATWLNLQGIRLSEVRIVPDRMDAIGNAVEALRHANDYLFTTGGIGPTHDDITVDAIAADHSSSCWVSAERSGPIASSMGASAASVRCSTRSRGTTGSWS